MNNRFKVCGIRICQNLQRIISALMIMSVTAVTPAQAVFMKLDFEGSISFIYLPDDVFPGLNVGDMVTGSLVYDPTTPDGNPATQIGYYEDAVKRLRLMIGNRNFPMLPPPESSEIAIENDTLTYGTYYDSLFFKAAVMDQSFQVSRFFQLSFAESSSNPPTDLTSDALDASIDINGFVWAKNGFIAELPPWSGGRYYFNLTSVSLYPVPEAILKWGDVNGDSIVDLSDAILALQIISNMSPSVPIDANADSDGDGKIGMEEVIYILQRVSDLR